VRVLNSCWTLKFFFISLVGKMENNISFALGKIGMIDRKFMSFLSSLFILVKTVYYINTWASSWPIDYFIIFKNSIHLYVILILDVRWEWHSSRSLWTLESSF
jgi:hypothetical protein